MNLKFFISLAPAYLPVVPQQRSRPSLELTSFFIQLRNVSPRPSISLYRPSEQVFRSRIPRNFEIFRSGEERSKVSFPEGERCREFEGSVNVDKSEIKAIFRSFYINMLTMNHRYNVEQLLRDEGCQVHEASPQKTEPPSHTLCSSVTGKALWPVYLLISYRIATL